MWGESLVARGDESVAVRIDYVFVRGLGRSPNAGERDRMLGFVGRLAQFYDVKPVDVPSSKEIWQDVAHAMFNMKELIYIR